MNKPMFRMCDVLYAYNWLIVSPAVYTYIRMYIVWMGMARGMGMVRGKGKVGGKSLRISVNFLSFCRLDGSHLSCNIYPPARPCPPSRPTAGRRHTVITLDNPFSILLMRNSLRACI